jgi:hypothetical protein
MSKRARVDFANVLLRAGYDKVKTLRAIKYPFCKAILADVKYADIPTDEMDVTVIFDPDYQNKMIINTGQRVKLEEPVPPMFSRLEYSQTAVFYFYYEDSDIPQSLFQPNRVTIPAPPEWPEISFNA